MHLQRLALDDFFLTLGRARDFGGGRAREHRLQRHVVTAGAHELTLQHLLHFTDVEAGLAGFGDEPPSHGFIRGGDDCFVVMFRLGLGRELGVWVERGVRQVRGVGPDELHREVVDVVDVDVGVDVGVFSRFWVRFLRPRRCFRVRRAFAADRAGALEECAGEVGSPALARGGSRGGALVRGHRREGIRDHLFLGDDHRVGRDVFFRILLLVLDGNLGLLEDDVAVHDRLHGPDRDGIHRRGLEDLPAQRRLVAARLLSQNLLHQQLILDHALLRRDRSLRRLLRSLHSLGLDGLRRGGAPRGVQDELLEAILAARELVAHREKLGQRRVGALRILELNRRGIRTVAAASLLRRRLLLADLSAQLLLARRPVLHPRHELFVFALLVDQITFALGEPVLERGVLPAVNLPPVLVFGVVLAHRFGAVDAPVLLQRLQPAGIVER